MSFPFKIELPDWLPSSFMMYLGSNQRLAIRYKLKATLQKFESLQDTTVSEDSLPLHA